MSTTTPAPSWPRIAGNSPSGSAPDSVNSSVWQMPVALISTSTSPSRGPSSWTVVTSSGFPAATATAARTSMAFLVQIFDMQASICEIAQVPRAISSCRIAYDRATGAANEPRISTNSPRARRRRFSSLLWSTGFIGTKYVAQQRRSADLSGDPHGARGGADGGHLRRSRGRPGRIASRSGTASSPAFWCTASISAARRSRSRCRFRRAFRR